MSVILFILACLHVALALVRFFGGADPRYAFSDLSAAMGWFAAWSFMGQLAAKVAA